MRAFFVFLCLVHCCVCASEISSVSDADDTLIFSHGLDGTLEKALHDIVNDFQQQEPSIKIKTVNKGNYSKTLEAFSASPDESDIIQISEISTIFMQRSNKFVPISTVFAWNNTPVPLFIPAMSSFYKGHSKTLQCLPFTASTVVLFYNKTLLDRLGLVAPETFEDFWNMASQFKKKGVMLPLAAGWLSGHHMDQIGAIHNIPITTKGNGVDGPNPTFVANPFFNTHWMFLQTCYHAGLFSLKSGPDAERAFADGDVVFLSQGANRQGIIEKTIDGRFEIGVAHFPYWKSIGKPGKTIAGGSALWVVKKKYSQRKKIAIAKFLAFLSCEKTQRILQQKTGYIPVVRVPQNDALPHAVKLAQEAFSRSEPLENNRGILLHNFQEIRDFIVSKMKDVIQGRKSNAMDELADIVEKGNELLRKNG